MLADSLMLCWRRKCRRYVCPSEWCMYYLRSDLRCRSVSHESSYDGQRQRPNLKRRGKRLFYLFESKRHELTQLETNKPRGTFVSGTPTESCGSLKREIPNIEFLALNTASCSVSFSILLFASRNSKSRSHVSTSTKHTAFVSETNYFSN